jgi:hypothetical protein
MAGRLTYRPVGGEGKPYPEWLRGLDGKSGVYVIRQRGRVVYVGESHADRLYGTVTRHFQGWKRRKKWWSGVFSKHDPGLTYERATCEVAVRVVPKGRAVDAQNALIRRLDPKDNVLGQDEAPF